MTRNNLSFAAAALVAAMAFPVSGASAQQTTPPTPPIPPQTGSVSDAQVSFNGVTVVRIDTIPQSEGAHLSAVLSTGGDSVTAMIAPVDFLTEKQMTLSAGDVIDISGTREAKEGKQSLVASEIRKGDAKLELRDKTSGEPAWPKKQ